jgi:hypothetical protein
MTETRRILAPHILPVIPPALQQTDEGPLYYLSWPGWELYLTRRLGLSSGPDSPRPILLADTADAETDFKAIDQLNTMAAQMGANFFTLAAVSPESLPALLGSIRAYQGEKKAAPPILDDRAYLALWAINEQQSRQNEALLAEALLQEKKMWAALKGEETPSTSSPAPGEETPTEPDSRTLYAWRVWRRLAEAVLGAGDVVVPTAAC